MLALRRKRKRKLRRRSDHLNPNQRRKSSLNKRMSATSLRLTSFSTRILLTILLYQTTEWNKKIARTPIRMQSKTMNRMKPVHRLTMALKSSPGPNVPTTTTKRMVTIQRSSTRTTTLSA